MLNIYILNIYMLHVYIVVEVSDREHMYFSGSDKLMTAQWIVLCG